MINEDALHYDRLTAAEGRALPSALKYMTSSCSTTIATAITNYLDGLGMIRVAIAFCLRSASSSSLPDQLPFAPLRRTAREVSCWPWLSSFRYSLRDEDDDDNRENAPDDKEMAWLDFSATRETCRVSVCRTATMAAFTSIEATRENSQKHLVEQVQESAELSGAVNELAGPDEVSSLPLLALPSYDAISVGSTFSIKRPAVRFMLGQSDVVCSLPTAAAALQLMIEALPQTAPPAPSTATTTSDATNSLRADGGSTSGGSAADLLFERALEYVQDSWIDASSLVPAPAALNHGSTDGSVNLNDTSHTERRRAVLPSVSIDIQQSRLLWPFSRRRGRGFSGTNALQWTFKCDARSYKHFLEDVSPNK